MKKILTLITTIVLSLIITFVFAEIFSLYHFGDFPTLLTTSYLVTFFFIFEYILLSIIYIIKKKINHEKIGVKKLICLVLWFIFLVLILGFIVSVNIDWLNYYSYFNSSPFYVFVLVRALEFLLPSVILIIISIVLLIKE